MKSLWVGTFLTAILSLGCASTEAPLTDAPHRHPAGSNVQQVSDSLKKERLQKMDVYDEVMYASGKRLLEQDCLMYKEPNLYSQRLSKVSGGREVWTEDTGLAWYKVFRKDSVGKDGVGYLSKICFKN